MAEPSPAVTVPDILCQRVAQSPAAVAFAYEADSAWRNITWSDFSQRVDALARALLGRGLAPGEHVGILAPTGLGWELFHHAILRAGGVVVGLDVHDTAERLQWIANHANLRMLVVHSPAMLGKLERDQVADYRGVILLEAPTELSPDPNLVLWPDLEAEGLKGSDALPFIPSDAPATLIYTSGTTGQPKGILYRHDQVVLAVQAIAQAYPSLPVGARFVCWLPLSNLFQRIMNVAAMRTGGTVYLVSNPLSVVSALPIAQPDVFIGVPRFYEKLHDGIRQEIARKPRLVQSLIDLSIAVGNAIARGRRDGGELPVSRRLALALVDALVLRKLRRVMGGRVRFMVTGSAPTTLRILEFFNAVGLPLYEAYGLSENIVPMALNRPGESRLGTVGKPLPENTLRLAEDGELTVKGAGVFGGYFKDSRPDLFTSDGYYRTGDYAALDPDGFVRLTGRKSEIIKTSTGRRIAPVAVEAKLEESPYVDRAVVVGSGRKCLSAILVIKAGVLGERDADPVTNPGNPRSNGGTASTLREIAESVTRAGNELAAHEQPLGYLMSTAPFSIETGELTPNLKLRRTAIEARFRTELDALYDEMARRPAERVVRLI